MKKADVSHTEMLVPPGRRSGECEAVDWPEPTPDESLGDDPLGDAETYAYLRASAPIWPRVFPGL